MPEHWTQYKNMTSPVLWHCWLDDGKGIAKNICFSKPQSFFPETGLSHINYGKVKEKLRWWLLLLLGHIAVHTDAAYCYRWSCVVCRSVSRSVCQSLCLNHEPAKMAEPIKMSSGMCTWVGPTNHVLAGGPDHQVKRQFWGGEWWPIVKQTDARRKHSWQLTWQDRPGPSCPALSPRHPNDCWGWRCLALTVAHSLGERNSFPVQNVEQDTGFQLMHANNPPSSWSSSLTAQYS